MRAAIIVAALLFIALSGCCGPIGTGQGSQDGTGANGDYSSGGAAAGRGRRHGHSAGGGLRHGS